MRLTPIVIEQIREDLVGKPQVLVDLDLSPISGILRFLALYIAFTFYSYLLPIANNQFFQMSLFPEESQRIERILDRGASRLAVTTSETKLDTTENFVAKDGYIDHILQIFEKHKHPFILVGAVAQRWMGSRLCVDTGFDIVLRIHQLGSIVADLVKTGHWTPFDVHKELANYAPDMLECFISKGRDLMGFGEADVVLEQVDIAGLGFIYLRIWSEDTYHIKIDGCTLVEVPELFTWNKVLTEKKYHPAIKRADG